MLSIGKVTAGNENYYEQQVAQGREDYYSGRGEAPGQWAGKAAEELGLHGQVTAEQFGQVIGQHVDPGTGEQLRAPSKVHALDFTFSAPKSVSVLYAVGDEETRTAVREAHEHAVDAAMGYMESEVAQGRRGKGGAEKVRVGGLIEARYQHRFARPVEGRADPQLHTHVVTANLVRGVEDGRWGAVDAYPLYQAAKAVGSLYQAELRAELRERLPGIEWGPVREGAAEIAGVDQEVIEEFSSRRQEILEWVKEHGEDKAGRRLENAVGATRAPKEHTLEEREVWADIRARAAEHGLGVEELAALRDRDPSDPAPVTDGKDRQVAWEQGGREALERVIGRHLAGPYGATKSTNTFGKARVIEEVAAAARQGGRVEDLVASTERVLGHDGIVPVGDAGDGMRWTTEDLLAHEREIVEGFRLRQGEGVGVLDADQARRTLAGRPVELNDGQRAAFEQAIGSGDGITHIEALAGTGKTATLGEIAATYRDQGYRVIGTAKTGRAARELNAVGVPSQTTAKLLGLLDRYQEARLDDRPTVLLVDEGAMIETREAARLHGYAARDRVKVIEVGDPGQLPAVDAGGWYGAVTRAHGAVKLDEVMRQRDKTEVRALAGVHDRKPGRWIALKVQQGELRVHQSSEAAELAAVARWRQDVAHVGPSAAVMIARSNDLRERLNQAAREQLQRDRLVAGEGVQTAGGREFAEGDRVIARRNDQTRDVDNGSRGTVIGTDRDAGSVTVELDGGARRRLPRLGAAAIGAGMVLALLEHALDGALRGNLGERGVALALLLGGGMAAFFALALAFSGIDRVAIMRRLRGQAA